MFGTHCTLPRRWKNQGKWQTASFSHPLHPFSLSAISQHLTNLCHVAKEAHKYKRCTLVSIRTEGSVRSECLIGDIQPSLNSQLPPTTTTTTTATAPPCPAMPCSGESSRTLLCSLTSVTSWICQFWKWHGDWLIFVKMCTSFLVIYWSAYLFTYLFTLHLV